MEDFKRSVRKVCRDYITIVTGIHLVCTVEPGTVLNALNIPTLQTRKMRHKKVHLFRVTKLVSGRVDRGTQSLNYAELELD